MATSNEPTDENAGPGRLAFDMMVRLGIPAEPRNFEVWYTYYAGTNAELTVALDVLLGNKTEFTRERNEEIHSRYLGFQQGGAELSEIARSSRRVEVAVGQVLEHLGAASKDQSAYGQKLAGFSDRIASGAEPGDIAALLEAIGTETRDMIGRTQAVHARLTESTKEITQLRQRVEEARVEAMTDALTGIGNRKLFDLTLRQEAKEAMEDGESLCVLLADIDHFKAFNDTYGHKVGDEVLKVVARTLDNNVKGRDTAARYGGEEFAVILPRTALAAAVTVAEQIRTALAERELKSRRHGQSYGQVTLSIGVAQYRYGEQLDDLVARADEGLYAAKDMGRNRVVAEPASGGEEQASA